MVNSRISDIGIKYYTCHAIAMVDVIIADGDIVNVIQPYPCPHLIVYLIIMDRGTGNTIQPYPWNKTVIYYITGIAVTDSHINRSGIPVSTH